MREQDFPEEQAARLRALRNAPVTQALHKQADAPRCFVVTADSHKLFAKSKNEWTRAKSYERHRFTGTLYPNGMATLDTGACFPHGMAEVRAHFEQAGLYEIIWLDEVKS